MEVRRHWNGALGSSNITRHIHVHPYIHSLSHTKQKHVNILLNQKIGSSVWLFISHPSLNISNHKADRMRNWPLWSWLAGGPFWLKNVTFCIWPTPLIVKCIYLPFKFDLSWDHGNSFVLKMGKTFILFLFLYLFFYFWFFKKQQWKFLKVDFFFFFSFLQKSERTLKSWNGLAGSSCQPPPPTPISSSSLSPSFPS